jgi:hypothetical protein
MLTRDAFSSMTAPSGLSRHAAASPAHTRVGAIKKLFANPVWQADGQRARE